MIGAWVLMSVVGSTPISLDQVRDLSRRNTAALLQRVALLLAHEVYRTDVSIIYPHLNLGADVSERFIGPTRQVQSFPTGQVDANGNPTFVQQVVDVPGLNQGNFDAFVSASQLFFDGGNWWNLIAQGGAQEDAVRGQLLDQELASEYEGMRRFYQLYLAQRTLDELEATMRRSADQVTVAFAMFEAGRNPKSDAIAAQVNLGNDQIAAISQKGSLANAQSDLAVWTLLRGDEDLVAVEPREMQTVAAPAPSLEAAVRSARAHRPLIKALADLVRAADLGIGVARAGFFPTLTGSAQYTRQGPSFNPTFTQLDRQNSFSIGVALRWNLFSGMATDSAVKTALHNRTQAEINLTEAQRELEGDVRRNLRVLQAQLEALAVAQKTVEAAKNGLVLARARFKAGAGSTLEVRDAQLKLTVSELAVIQSQVNAETARAALGRVMGTLHSGG